MTVDDPLFAMVGRPGGPLADAALWSLTVATVDAITDDYRRVTFGGPDLERLAYLPGQDLMLRIPSGQAAVVNRRYTIRRADPAAGTVVIDMVVHGDGPGARWAAGAVAGDTLDAIGPRGGIVVDGDADWHLFIGDETALPGMAAMIESLPPQVPGVMIVELPKRAEGHDPDVGSDRDVQVTWIERGDAEPGDASRLVAAAASVALPSGRGRAYVAGEMKVVRAIATALASRGLERDQISTKAYWRRGEANAPHGEPLDPDRPMRPRR
jgi:NADPH-dependent ferric siderophore reductase